MVKPTILQSLLNRPSQSYSFPQAKTYYSTKRDMVRIATETCGGEGPHGEESKASMKVVESAVTNLSIADLHDDDSDSDLDVFYTPNSSPRTSVVVNSAITIRSTTTPVMHSNSSCTSLSSSFGAPSLFSLPASDSTRVTTPLTSDAGHTTPDWAKDVRWLVPDRDSTPDPKSTITPSPSLRRRRHTSETSPQPQQKQLSLPPKSLSHPQTRSKPNTPISKSISKTNPSIMSNMAALLEEDEPHVGDHNPRSSVLIAKSPVKQNHYPATRNRTNPAPIPRSRSPSPHRLPHKRSRSLGHTTPPSLNQNHTNPRTGFASSSNDPFLPTSTSLPTFTPGNLPSHGTRGFTSLVLPRAPVPFAQSSSNHHHHQRIGAGLIDSIGVGAGAGAGDGKVDLTRSGVAQTTMASVEVLSGLSGDLGSGGGILGKGKAPGKTGGGGGGKGVMGLFKRGRSVSGPSSAFGRKSSSPKRSQSEDVVVFGNGHLHSHAHVRGAVERPLGFTSYRKPPGYVPSGSVLIQVWAVGVDGLDGRLVLGGACRGGGGVKEKDKSHVPYSNSGSAGDAELELGLSRSTTPVPLLSSDQKEKRALNTPPKRSLSLRSTLGRFAGSSPNVNGGTLHGAVSGTPGTGSSGGTSPAGVGYIPGRSFVGRVLECGWDVGEEVGKRGDWVVGLLDVKKCGALTEFIVVDRRRIHRAPYPCMESDNPFLLAERDQEHTPSQGPSRSSSIRSTSTSRPSTSSRHSHSNSATFPSPAPSRHASMNSKYSTNRPSVPSPLSHRHLSHSSPHSHLNKPQPPLLTMEEMALLPVCGIPAYRAVRTFAFEFAAAGERDEGGVVEGSLDFGSVDVNFGVGVGAGVGGNSVPTSSGTRMGGGLRSGAGVGVDGRGSGRERGRGRDGVIGRDGRRRRVLVVRGHDGAGAMALQMLARRGWRVCVHVPFRCVKDDAERMMRRYEVENDEGEEEGEEEEREGRYQYCMRMVEERVRAWGGEEVIFDDGEDTDGDDGRGAVVRAIDRLRAEGDMFDAVLDTVGGKEVWEASERLLRSLGRGDPAKLKKEAKKGGTFVKQFTTLVGDSPGRTIPSAKDNMKAGFRALNISVGREGKKPEGGGRVGYAWVSVAHDVDWEGEDVSGSLEAVLRLAVEDGVRPWVGLRMEKDDGKGKGNVKAEVESNVERSTRVVPFEKAPDVFVNRGRALADGGTVVIKIVG